MDKSVPGSESEPTIVKRNVKHLTLNRETVRLLNMEEMSAAQGGEFYLVTAYVICVPKSSPTNCGRTDCCAV